MWIVLIGGLLITLPALVVALWFMGHPAALPAAASLAINSLPFLAAYVMLRRQHKKGHVEDSHH